MRRALTSLFLLGLAGWSVGCGSDGPATMDAAGHDGGRDASARGDGSPVRRDGAPPADAPSLADTGAPDAGPVHDVFPGASWETRTPTELGMDGAAVDAFAAAVGGNGCMVKDGYLVRTWGDPSARFDWASASKPVMATMLFFAVAEGRLSSVDDAIADQGWPLSAADASMTFRHLADMTSGYARGEGPGEAWAYNDYAISLYAQTLFDRVFDDGSADAAARQPSRLGALDFEDGPIFGSRGGYGLETSCRDFARIGWLWLNRGRWRVTQLLPRRFFDEHMRPDVPADLPRTTVDGSDYLGVGTHGGGRDQTPHGPGIYGFNWWFNAEVGTSGAMTWPDAPADTFQANGHWNREVMTVIPSLGLVVAARGDWGEFAPGDPAASMNGRLSLLSEAAR